MLICSLIWLSGYIVTLVCWAIFCSVVMHQHIDDVFSNSSSRNRETTLTFLIVTLCVWPFTLFISVGGVIAYTLYKFTSNKISKFVDK